MTANASITKRLTLAVLLLEFVAAVLLIATVGDHERHVQFSVFKANLRANANTLFGALQEADARDGSLVLDLDGVAMPPRAVYRVDEAEGQVLGSQGRVPNLAVSSGTFTESATDGEHYLFYTLTGERAVDPGKPFAVHHHVRITYGLPIGRVWHEVFEAIRFFAVATLILLGVTAIFLTWLIRRFLLPIRDLATEADKIDSNSWVFDAPASSKRFVELSPLASAIERSLLRLQRSFEQQRRFTSDAAHELKTDLAIVKSSLQLLGMKRRPVEEYEQGLLGGLEDIERMEATVHKMLTLARLEQSPRFEHQSCDFAEAMTEAINLSQPFAELRQVTVMLDITGARTSVTVGKDDALLLCSNVLLNALQHAPINQKVEVRMRCDDAFAHLVIRDYGAGVAEEDRPFLFDAFYRGDSSRSRKTGGTGLGLSICKAICVRAGGSISIANHKDGGAVVEIDLPLSSPSSLKT
jgi:signal transduction histidine kinase